MIAASHFLTISSALVPYYFGVMEITSNVTSGQSSFVVAVLPSLCTTRIPLETLPKMLCLPSNQGHGASVIKNCEPLELGPELAIEMIPASAQVTTITDINYCGARAHPQWCVGH